MTMEKTEIAVSYRTAEDVEPRLNDLQWCCSDLYDTVNSMIVQDACRDNDRWDTLEDDATETLYALACLVGREAFWDIAQRVAMLLECDDNE